MGKLIIAYIKFWLRSKNQHGVQSPFVYALVTKCFHDHKNYDDYPKLRAYKKALLKNKETIEVTDLGSGSQMMKSNTRIIANIAKNASSTYLRTKLLYRIIRYFQPKTILELGTSMGLATQAMATASPKTQVITIEGCPNTSAFTKVQLASQNLTNIELLTGDFAKVIPTLSHENFDIVFLDGNHSKEPTLAYFNMLLPKATNNSVFIFDDIYRSKGMTEAWETVKKHPKVTVSIDTFFWGFVFFRKEQAKEHFTIRV